MSQKDLQSLREKIDLLDAGIIQKLAARQKLSKQIGQLKAASGQQIIDTQREAQQKNQYQKLCAQYQIDPKIAEKIFKIIITHSRKIQKHGLLVPSPSQGEG